MKLASLLSDREMQLNVTTPVKTKRLEVVVERLSEVRCGETVVEVLY